MKKILIVLALFTFAMAQRNAVETDTTKIFGFKGNTLVYSHWLPLASYTYTRIDVYMNDTSVAGFVHDTLKFIWGVQYGHRVFNSSGNIDTAPVPGRLILDTFDMTETTNFVDTTYVLGADGTFTEIKGMIDTASVSGYAFQSVQAAVNWDQYVRVFLQGLSGQENRVNIYNKILILRGNK
jgi:hypothetical protein